MHWKATLREGDRVAQRGLLCSARRAAVPGCRLNIYTMWLQPWVLKRNSRNPFPTYAWDKHYILYKLIDKVRCINDSKKEGVSSDQSRQFLFKTTRLIPWSGIWVIFTIQYTIRCSLSYNHIRYDWRWILVLLTWLVCRSIRSHQKHQWRRHACSTGGLAVF